MTSVSDTRFDWLLRMAVLLLLPATTLFISTATPVDEGKWMIVQLGAPFLLAVWLLRSSLRDGPGLPVDPLSIAMYLGLASMLISIFPAINPFMGAIEAGKRFSLVCVYALVIVLLQRRSGRSDVIWVLVGTGLFGGLYGIAQHFGYDFFPWAENKYSPLERGVSFYGHATFAGSYLVLVIPLAAGLAAAPGAVLGRVLAVLALCVMLYHLSFSGARAATLGFLASAGVVFLMVTTSLVWRRERRQSLRIPIWALISGGLVCAAIGGLLLYQAWNIKDSDLFALRQVSGALRLYTWETASRLFVENPILGAGTGNYEVVIPLTWNLPEASHFSVNGTIMHQAHNEYLETAAEQGLPGIAILIATIVLALLYAFDAWRHADSVWERRMALALLASVIAGSVDAVFIFNFQTAASATALWAIFGLITAQRSDLLRRQAEVAQGTEDVDREIGHVIVEKHPVPAK